LKRVAVIKGDGVGPELVENAVRVIKATGAELELTYCDAGYEWWEKNGGQSFIPEETWKILESSDCCLKGPTTTLPVPNTPKSVAVSIRQKFDLYANVRPIKTFPNHVGPLGEVDMVMVREATEGLYVGLEHRLSDDVSIAIKLITKTKSTKIALFAFNEARKRSWKKVVAISKANILKVTDGLFLECVRNVSKEFPDIEVEDVFIDNFAQQLVKNPQRYNYSVVVGPNLYMDILSEEASGLIGSIGLVYSGNFGDKYAMFEPAHGSAPKYKGTNKSNPTATILSAAWMLDYLGMKENSRAIFEAVKDVISEGKHVTYDLGGNATTTEMTDAIIEKLKL